MEQVEPASFHKKKDQKSTKNLPKSSEAFAVDVQVQIPLLSDSKRKERMEKKRKDRFRRYLALIIVGLLTALYSVAETGIAIKTDSIALLSDGVHNLSDVISLGIAFWALKKSTNKRSDKMTYGWRRTEIIGALMNGCFLISLCFYIVLEAIPKFMEPKFLPHDFWFIATAGAGLGVNTLGTILFAVISGGHGHSHAGGGGHDHSHGGKSKEKDKHGHSHSAKKDKEKHGHSHNKKDKGHKHSQSEENHGHSHNKPKEKKSYNSQDLQDYHPHSDSTTTSKTNSKTNSETNSATNSKILTDGEKMTSCSSEEIVSYEGEADLWPVPISENNLEIDTGYKYAPLLHDLSDDDMQEESHHKEKGEDHNIRAVFLHYLGDAVSSLLVLGAGLLSYFFEKQEWTKYLDPGSSILITILIFWTTLPLIRDCSRILLQQVPTQIKVGHLKDQLLKIRGVRNIHELHVWQLVDDLVIASVHASIDEKPETKSSAIVASAKKVMHQFGIHSSTIQLENESYVSGTRCGQNCAPDCKEEWCCKDASFTTFPNSL